MKPRQRSRRPSDAEIVRGYLDGKPRGELAPSDGAVRAALKRAGVRPNRRPGGWWPQAAELHRAGRPPEQISRDLGVPYEFVAHALRVLGLTGPRPSHLHHLEL